MYTIRAAAIFLGVSSATLRRWDRSGLLPAIRTAGRHRRYPYVLLEAFFCGNPLPVSPYIDDPSRPVLCYARVSSFKQKQDGNLDRQRDRIETFARTRYPQSSRLIITDYGSGLNPHRKGLQRAIRLIRQGKVARVIVEFSDRLTRFGYPYLEALCAACGTTLESVESPPEDALEQILVNDMMALLASFSGKLYSLRSRRVRQKQRNAELSP